MSRVLAASLAVLAAACGGSVHSPDSRDSIDGGGGGDAGGGGDDAGYLVGDDTSEADGGLDAYIAQGKVAVKLVTLSCAGDCVTVQAVGTGGSPPYSYKWEDGSTSAVRQLCPKATVAYGVSVTDTGNTGELPRPPQTVEASLTADVLSCPDGGAVESGAPPGVHPDKPTLAVGGGQSCVVRAGKLECWGSDYAGVLGIGSSTGPQSCNAVDIGCSPTPVAVTGLSASVVSVAAGGTETCAVLSGGSVACWGANYVGQLGNGSTSGPAQCPGIGACSTTPVLVSGVSGATAVATGGGEACALLSSGAVDCWGSDDSGELGDPAAPTTSVTVSGYPVSPLPVMVTGLTGATAIAVGSDYACALLLDGTVRCWGSNAYGQLGNGTTTDARTPVRVSNVTGAAAIAATGDHACALMMDGTVACWGLNASGQLGLGTSSGPQTCGGNEACATAPVKVPSLSGVAEIAVGADDTCALLSNGTVQCWGSNADGELGHGTMTDSLTPVAVSGLSGATAIAMGGQSACALVSSGGVECWGDNGFGEVGVAVPGPETCSLGPCSTVPRNIPGL